MTASEFSGNKKVGRSVLHGPEQRFISWATPRVPRWIETWHLTLATVPICAAIVLCSFLAKEDIRWLWGVSVAVALQWVTDSLDGAVGRARDTGLVRWGYYMDHLLDYFFLAAVMVGYMILLPDHSKWLFFFVFALFAGFMVNAFLVMASLNEFRISHLGIGPTEIRLAFIVINALVILFGKTHMAFVLPGLLAFAFAGLVYVVWVAQRRIWEIDMAAKRSRAEVSPRMEQ